MLNKRLSLSIILIIFTMHYSSAQWVNNPAVNTLLVQEVINPVNITSVEDFNGGAFIFWEDNRTGIQSDIYFIHLDGNGKVNFRVDGKKVTDNDDIKELPAAASSANNTAVVVWKSTSGRNKGNLFAQKVNSRGQLLWHSMGLQLTNTNDNIIHYAVDSDKQGNTFIVYTEREGNDHDIHLQKITSAGNLAYDLKNQPIVLSSAVKSIASVIADEEGGAYLLWLQTENNKSQILAHHIDQAGKNTWGKKPISISGSSANIVAFSANLLKNNSIYAAWQVHKSDKDIYHQLISKTGKLLWLQSGKPATRLSGNQINPQVLTSDSNVILSWTQEDINDRDVFIQKYNLNGDPLWSSNGVPVIKLEQDQFGQKIVTDGKGGAIVTWIDRRDEKKYENLYAQRVNRTGKLVWDTLAIPVASHPASEKSYPSVISDSRGGIIAVFKDKRENHTGIFGQKVFNTGTYISQILGFQTEIDGDSVIISWYSANETGETIYEVERASSSDTTSGWEVINYIVSDGKLNANKFEFKDKPIETGTVYYRLIQTDDKGNIQPSDISKVDYFFGASDFSLAQNSPNPFTDSTIIKFYLPKEMNVSVEYFDSHIEKIGEVKERFAAGENQLVFNAEGLQQGIYFYRFEAGDYVDVKKMVIVR